MSLASLEPFRPLIAAVLTTSGLIILSRLLPAFERMMEPHSAALGVAYDMAVAVFVAFTFASFLAGLGFV
jgi:hypothetical protein